ncbi:MAG: hypothetical protein KAY37_08895 [Phycisphaerae bacterium]|nr:hypothetical protein [Phycisphaerae bacterium]
MTMLPALLLLGWPFIHPLDLPAGARLWMLLPLVACVATVYRATRVHSMHRMARATAITFVNIVVGMTLIALAFYLLHLAARQFL